MTSAESILVAIKRLLGVKERDLTLSSLFYRVEDALYEYGDENETEFLYPYVMELMTSNEGQYAIFSDGGKLFRANFSVDGNDMVTITETYQVKIDYPKVESSNINRVTLFRSKDNELLWIGIASSSVLNRSGEIDSTKLFDDFEANFSDFEEPYLTLQHLPKEFAFGKVRNVFRLDSLLFAYGVIDEKTILGSVAEERFNSGDWGMSIGFMPSEPPEVLRVNDVKIPVYNKGVLIEISALLEERAAAYFTKIISSGKGENRMVNKIKAKELLLEFAGEEKEDEVDALLDEAGKRERQIDNEGMITREEEINVVAEAVDGDVEAEKLPEEEKEEEIEFVLDDTTRDMIVNSVSEKLNDIFEEKFKDFDKFQEDVNRELAELSAFVSRANSLFEVINARNDNYEERLSGVERSDKEKIDNAVNDLPSSSKRQVVVTHRPTGNDEKIENKPQSLRDIANATLSEIGVSEKLK